MLPPISLSFTARRVIIAPALSRAAGVHYKWAPSTLTRSFITSVARAEPAKAKDESTAKTKKTVAKDGAKEAVKKVVKKEPAKKADAKLIIPQGTKIPPRGPTSYIYFFTKVFSAEHVINKDTFGDVSRAAGAAWKALSESEKQASRGSTFNSGVPYITYLQKYRDISSDLRAQAHKKRQEYTNSLDSKIIKEMNRRRALRGKPKVHKIHGPNGRPLNGYIRFSNNYRALHPDLGRDVVKAAANAWNALTAEEKEVYRKAYETELVTWREKKAEEKAHV
ncbi:hypothetical protein H0H87_010846 [Tephrocybe sp. NHM501043]|nr:hypothetical protein H0H87_010846 [Tephrocybe sp. NHM501043]